MKKTKYLIITFMILLVDQISKYLVMTNMKLNKSIDIIPNFFKLTYTNNHGAAFSILEGRQVLIILVSLLVFLYLVYELFKKKNNSSILCLSISLILGGLLGNLVDRLVYGHVRDFLDFKIFSYDFAIFNIGDIGIVVGVILMLIGIILEEKDGDKNKGRE